MNNPVTDLFEEAVTLHQAGRFSEAITQFEKTIESRPFWPLPFLHLGMLYQDQGRWSDALAIYREGVRLCPDAARLRHNLGTLLSEMGQPDEAWTHCSEATRLAPDQAEVRVSLGNVLAILGQSDQAKAQYEQAIELAPTLANAYARLGLLARSVGQLDYALNCLKHAIQRDPTDASFHIEAGGVLYELERSDEAIAATQEAIRLKPDVANYHNSLGYLFQDQGCMNEALSAYNEAVRRRPDYADAFLNIGVLHTELGEKSESVTAFREALRHNPDHPEALAGLGLALRNKIEPDELAAAERVMARRDIPESRRAVLLYGIAQVTDARGEYERTAALASEANAIYSASALRSNRGYSTKEHHDYVSQIIAAYSPDHFERVQDWGNSSVRPIFVLGLPRSGTSLIEQILASHPKVHGAGELNLMRDNYRSIPALVGKSAPGVECIGQLNRDHVHILAKRYLERLLVIDSETEHVVDKMPDNYLMIGLIAMLFPNASIIHIRRDVRDVGLSCWLTHFKHIRWACDLEHIAQRIVEYQRLMAHWRETMPNRLIEIDYEAVVEDLPNEARNIVEACGLVWDVSCERFHETKRVVRTASMTQVRQPIYRSSLGRWQRYGKHLTPMLDVLQLPAE